MKKLLIMSIALLFGVNVGFAQAPAKNVKSVRTSAKSSFDKAKAKAKANAKANEKEACWDNPKTVGIKPSRKGTQSEPIRLIDDNTAKSKSVSKKGTQSEPIRLIDDDTAKSKSRLGTKSGVVGNDTDGPTGDFNRSAGNKKTRVSNPVRR